MTDVSHEELARLRAIAEEGRTAPLFGGWHLVLWGAAMSAALLVNWAVIERHLSWPPSSLAFSWFGLAALAWLGSLLIGRRQGDRPGAFGIGSRVERMVWIVAGGFLSLFAVTLFLRATLVGGTEAWRLFEVMPPVGFGAYAVAIGASSAVSHDRGAQLYVLASLLLAAATTFLIGNGAQYPVAAAGLAIVSIGYGLRQLRAERMGG